VSESDELTVVVTFIYQADMLCFIQIYLVFVVTWLEGENKYMIKHIT